MLARSGHFIVVLKNIRKIKLSFVTENNLYQHILKTTAGDVISLCARTIVLSKTVLFVISNKYKRNIIGMMFY
jgi:hypothetical protein